MNNCFLSNSFAVAADARMYWDQNEVWYISVGGVYKIYSINSLNLKNGLQRTSTGMKKNEI